MLSAILLSASLVSGVPHKDTQAPGTGSGAGPAHPAPGFCVAQGGISSIYVAPDGGQIGVCRLRDNSLIEEMTLWREAKVKDPREAARKFLQASWHTGQGEASAWANQNCESVGGQPVVYHEYLRPTSTLVLCQFADNSAVETWTLLAGPDYYPRLAELIKPAS